MPFPLRFIPDLSFHKGGRRFGAPRDGGTRKHAGCDLIAPLGSEVLAIDDGVVIQESRPFYRGTNSLVIQHPNGLVARYCEILNEKELRLTRGAVVRAGEVVAHVGKMNVDSMLHFELFSGATHGDLTQRNHGPFQRRADLLDPTALLSQLARDFMAVYPAGRAA